MNAIDIITSFQERAPVVKDISLILGVIFFIFSICFYLKEIRLQKYKKDYFLTLLMFFMAGLFFLFSLSL